MNFNNPASFDSMMNNRNPMNISSNASVSFISMDNSKFSNDKGLSGGATILNYNNYAINVCNNQPVSIVTDLVTDAYGNLNSSHRERNGTENCIRSGLATIGTTAALCGGPPGAVVGGVIGGSLLASEVFEANVHANIGMNNNITRLYTEKFGDNEVARQMAEDAVWERSMGY
jgi:hypothetical protein